MDAEVDKVKKELGKAYDGKTADIQVRMLEGKLHRFLDDTVLMEMEFILQEG
jgi:translation elongation factor EF-Ts